MVYKVKFQYDVPCTTFCKGIETKSVTQTVTEKYISVKSRDEIPNLIKKEFKNGKALECSAEITADELLLMVDRFK